MFTGGLGRKEQLEEQQHTEHIHRSAKTHCLVFCSAADALRYPHRGCLLARLFGKSQRGV